MSESQRGVYTITCTVNGRIYVGSSTNVHGRWKSHRSWLRNSIHYNKRLQADWNEHGEAAFQFRLVAPVHDADERHAMETALIGLYDSTVHGYNVSTTWQGSEGTVRSEDHRQAISQANRGVPKSEAHRRKLSDAQKAVWADREITPEFREQMAEFARRGADRAKSPEHRRKISEAQTGRTFTPEHIEAIRTAKRGVRPASAKLTADQAREIKQRLAARESVASIARAFGVGPATVSDIKHGRTWRHIT